ncbi:MAG TPA: hypothetical protein VM778_12985, partial [Gemmatimonadota bacterium]|nr:hypothetical protein [Gemmatimonadota bacterium]
TPRAATPPSQRPADRAGDERADAGETGRRAGSATLPDPRLATPREPITARPGRPAPAGADRLAVPEVDQRLTQATAGSSFSLNTTAWEFAPYMERLKRAIEGHISPPAAFYYGTAAWVTRVRFRIEPDGRLSRVELLDHAGVSNLQYVSTDAIRGAADYEPLPPGFPAEYLEVTGHFYFNVIPERD